MLDCEHAALERFRGILFAHCQRALGDNGTTVHTAVTKWTVAPCIFTPLASARRCVSSPLNAGSREGSNVEHLPLPDCSLRWSGQYAHESGKTGDLDPVLSEHLLESELKAFTVAAIHNVIDHGRCDARGLRM